MYDYHSLNCFQVSCLEVLQKGGRMVSGTAVAPDGVRYPHTWVVRDGAAVDRFGWSGHEGAVSAEFSEAAAVDALGYLEREGLPLP